MYFTVDSAFNSTAEVAAADKFPRIRVMTIGKSTTSPTPLREFGGIDQPWSLASSKTIGAGNWTEFSAVCWFFGRDLYQHLDGKVPIGLLSDNWGGTPIQAWSSPKALAACNVTTSGKIDGPHDNSQLWNAMIIPVLKMTIKAVLWYQGEQNVAQHQATYYACGFPAMIKDWRSRWNSETRDDFPFLFVQLAPWINSDLLEESELRLAQLVAMEEPNVGFAAAIDLGDPSSPWGSVHIRDKQPVGARLFLNARAIVYAEKMQYLGPWANDWSVANEGPTDATVIVTFYPDSIGQGLEFKDFPCPKLVPEEQCAGFQIQSKSGKWFKANAKIVGSTIHVSATTDVAGVSATSYGWANYPLATLWNKDGLPATSYYFPNPYPVHRANTE